MLLMFPEGLTLGFVSFTLCFCEFSETGTVHPVSRTQHAALHLTDVQGEFGDDP